MGKWLIKKGLRKCCKCKKIYPLKEEYFPKSNKKGDGGFRYVCRECDAKILEELRRHPIYMKNRREHQRQYRKRREVKERRNKRRKEKRLTDAKYRLDMNMHTAIWKTLKKQKAGRKWEELVGYSVNELMKHLERQFDENMNWENYGSYWHIDHIKPKSLFKYNSPDELEFKKCWALENLQPLEKTKNIKKYNHYRE